MIMLAAGRGTRMGSPKALMSVGGRAWWREQQERLTELRIASLWVVSEQVRRAMGGESGAPADLVIADTDFLASLPRRELLGHAVRPR